MSRKGFTLLEMLVTILIILTLITLIVPAVGKVRNKGKEIKCQANQRSLWQEATDYARDHGDAFNYVMTDLRCPSINLPYSLSGWQDFGRLSLKGNSIRNRDAIGYENDSLDLLWSDNFPAHRKPKNMGVTFNGRTVFY